MNEEEYGTHEQLEKAERIAYLIAGFLRGTLTPQEHDELDAWVEASPENMRLFEQLTDEHRTARELHLFQQANTREGLKRLHQRIRAGEKPDIRRRALLYAAAASIILLSVATLLFFSYCKQSTADALAANNRPFNTFLLTSGGDTVWMDNTADGNLATQGNTQVVKNGGLLSYYHKASVGISQQTVTNTLTTKRGGQFSLMLPDGSKVWLNAASSISFPTAFTGRERKVVLTGEAYFEVAKDAARPFQVWVGDAHVEVLGTHFDVNAYNDEVPLKVTLLEGSVRIVLGTKDELLRPGEEARLQNGNVSIAKANEERATGWHNGQLVFSNTSLSTVARELTRWYDVDVNYRGASNRHMSITISRGLPLEKVIHLLEGTGNVRFSNTGSSWEVR